MKTPEIQTYSHQPPNQACLHCEKHIIGRIDKKFCDAWCRNTYNNKVKRENERYILLVNHFIRKNRGILKHLCPIGKAVVRRDVLEAMGYNFRYFSNVWRSKGAVYYMCYEYGFSPIKEGNKQKALIIQKQDYMEDYPYNPWAFKK
ncbi:MAG: hypothetical protein IIB82_16390 [Bacteroidetes bacterium]|nr:hypothetical protein [Bacteroidota bacterium]